MKIDFRGVGRSEIICEASNGVNKSIEINVYELFPEKVETSLDDIKIECMKEASVDISILPDNANNKKYSVKIKNEDIATIKKNNIYAKKEGTTELLITTHNGITKTIPITVYHNSVKKVTIDDSSIDYLLFYEKAIGNKSELKLLATRCKDMDIEDTLELELGAANEEERDFISVISNFILQQKQRKVIEQKMF